MATKRKSSRTPRTETRDLASVVAEHIMHFYRDWLQPYLLPGTAVVAVVVLGLLIAVGVVGARTSRAERAFLALSEAEGDEDFSDVARQYHGTYAGAHAGLTYARRLSEKGNYSQAATRFSLLCQEYASYPTVVEVARLGEAYALEGDEKLIEAEKRFATLGDETVDTGMRIDAFIGAARCARLQGKLAEAEKWVQRARQALLPNAPAMLEERVTAAAEQLERLRRMPATEAVSLPEGEEQPGGEAEKAPAPMDAPGETAEPTPEGR